jgi:hypothetical protein
LLPTFIGSASLDVVAVDRTGLRSVALNDFKSRSALNYLCASW